MKTQFIKRLWLVLGWVLVAGCSTASAQALLWRLEKPGAERYSFLYGTMHSKSRKVFDFDDRVLQNLRTCEAFAAELDMDTASLLSAREKLFLPDNKTLQDYVSKKNYERIDKAFREETGMGVGMFQRMQPVFLMALLQEQGMMNGEMPQFLDQFLFQFAEHHGLKTFGIETVEEQTAALGSMSFDEQAEMLVKAARDLKKDKAEKEAQNQKLMDLYLNADLDAMLKLFDDEDMPADMKNALLEKRNTVMADRIHDMINQQSTFCAIGAAHLGGPAGVVALLRKKGYKIEAIPLPFDGSGYKTYEEERRTTDFSLWVDVARPEARFMVRMPGEPNHSRQRQPSTDGTDTITLQMYTWSNLPTGKNFIVMHSERDHEIKLNTNTNFKAEIEKQMVKMNGKLLDERDIELANIPGKEFTVEAMGVLRMTVRMIAVDNRIYQLIATSLNTLPDVPREREHFFNSFTITTE